jgi:CHASE1-domain containing sensor protein/two-component sensor histidine kinase
LKQRKPRYAFAKLASKGFAPRTLVLPVVVLLAGLLATLLLSMFYDRLASERDAERFEALAEQRIGSISERMSDYIGLLRGAAALMVSDPRGVVSASAFERYVGRLRLPDLYPGVQGIGFAAAIRGGDFEIAEQRIRSDVAADFRMWPDGEREFYAPIIYLEPRDERNRAAIGYDMFSEAVRRDAMERARDEGFRAASGKVELVQEIDDERQPGFLVYLPTYRGGAIPETLEERREALLGWVYSPFRARDLFNLGAGLNASLELAVSVYDGQSTAPENILYRSAPMEDAPPSLAYSTSRVIDIAGRPWTVVISTTRLFARDSARYLVPYLLAVGAIVSFLLALATFGQSRAAQRARDANAALENANETLEHQVEKRTAQLERARAKLAGLIANLEQAVDSRTADLTAANEEIQRFAYIVSHDLRAPLVNVMGFTSELDAVRADMQQFMREVAEKAPELVTNEARLAIETDLPEALKFIRASTVRMDRLINAILRLSREGRRVLTPERISMTDLVRGIEANLAHQIDEEGVQIVVENMPDIVSDRLALEQVFGNLIENAIKYLQPGRVGRVVVRGFEESGHYRYEIEDNGRGIDPKDHERVFDLFRRAGQQDQPGEGIGLAHVRALVRRLGGAITLTSQLGRGSTFQITLPKILESGSQEAA